MAVRGQQYYLDKYKRAWLDKRVKRTGSEGRGRKRAKTNMELCLMSNPQLQKFVQARPDFSKEAVKQTGHIKVRDIATEAGFTVKEKATVPVEQQEPSESHVEDEQIQWSQPNEVQNLASFDFLNRKTLRREFILERLAEQDCLYEEGPSEDRPFIQKRDNE